MSSQPIIIQITQGIIDAIGSGKTITPEKIVSEIGQTYDKNLDYIFTINENITIPTGITLKDFKNIVVNPTTTDITINNGGTIEDCIITLNTNDAGKGGIISNGYVVDGNNFEGNIINCHITLFGVSWFDNGDGGIGNINGGSITLNDYSKFYNGCLAKGIITDCSITLNGNADFCNGDDDEGNINDGSIILNDSSKFYNGYEYEGNINGGSITLSSNSEFYNGCEFEGNINDALLVLFVKLFY